MGENRNKPCRYRPTALLDLENIWSFTAERWSPNQADAYLLNLTDAVARLGENPRIVRERLEFFPPVRVYVFKSHIVIFREEDEHLDIIRIRHGREDWMTDLGERE